MIDVLKAKRALTMQPRRASCGIMATIGPKRALAASRCRMIWRMACDRPCRS
jgi:hypothetical protein